MPETVLTEWTAEGTGRFLGTLTGGGETVSFHMRTRPDRPARAVVLLVPILAGGAELMEGIAQRVHEHGFDVVCCARAGGALANGQRGVELEELFRRTVQHQRMVLRWLRERASGPRPSPPQQQFVLGVSLGGMVATVLAAHEPELAGVAVCLSGADLPDVIANSSEGRVQRWRDWRHREDGIGVGELRHELQQALRHEPLRYAPAVATERVLLVDATLDTVVPRRNQDLLWEAFGRPARYSLPLGHYTAAVAIDTIIARVADHFAARSMLAQQPREHARGGTAIAQPAATTSESVPRAGRRAPPAAVGTAAGACGAGSPDGR